MKQQGLSFKKALHSCPRVMINQTPSTNYLFLKSILTRGLEPIKRYYIAKQYFIFANNNILNQINQADSINSSFYLKDLTLRFVYCHCKINSHWKLSSGPFKWKFSFLGLECYSWNHTFQLANFPSTIRHSSK